MVISFVMAGVENTSAILAWALYELARHPREEHLLHAELDQVLAGRPARVEDLPELRHLSRIVAETFRLRSPWLLMRRAKQPVRLGVITVPTGAEVLYSPYALHRDPRWFPDPDGFAPDRWEPGNNPKPPKGAYIPFAIGPHQCIGNDFALTEVGLAPAVICQRWRLHLAPGVRVRETARAGVQPRGLRMTAEPRT